MRPSTHDPASFISNFAYYHAIVFYDLKWIGFNWLLSGHFMLPSLPWTALAESAAFRK